MQDPDQGARRSTVNAQSDMREERDEAAGEEARDVLVQGEDGGR